MPSSVVEDETTAGSGPVPVTHLFDTILILDFGSQYSHLITRRLREINVYAEMLPCTQKISELTWKPKGTIPLTFGTDGTGIILSGSPYSVYAEDAPHSDPELFDLGVPVLGICYGLCELAWTHGSKAVQADNHEYGHAMLTKSTHSPSSHVDTLFSSLPDDFQVWMSHGDKLLTPPENFIVIGTTPSAPLAAIAHNSKPWYGIQFHPEVTHTPLGGKIITNFAVEVCQCRQDWKMENFVQREITRIRQLVGETGQVVGAVSGGVDSTVAAKLMHEAIGPRFHAILVDNGLLRLDEAKQVHETLTGALGINLAVVDASELFLGRLGGVKDPEKKRKIIGNTFIEVFEREAEKLDQSTGGKIEWLLQGTLYPDVIESVSFRGPSQTIKTHHNVGGLLENMRLKLIEPLRELFKDEVRAMGTLLGIPEDLVWRHPFPGPGIGIRILGAVTPELVEIVRQADHIFISEIKSAGLYRKISQALAAVVDAKAVGVMGDQRTYEYIVALRAVTTIDFMTADIYEFELGWLKRVAGRIVNEVRGVNRCLYDVTTKPPGTVEFE